MNAQRISLMIAIAVLPGVVAAMTAADAAASPSGTVLVAQAASSMTDGEVRKVDKDSKKITIKHGEIRNLNMPPMTMVFQVKDAGMLEQVKPGDKVRFHAEQVNGALTVTQIEAGI